MFEALDALMEASAWAMDPPKAYGAFHILYTLIGFALCGILAWKLRRIGDKAFKWIIFSVGVVLAISEVYKQLFYYFAIEDNRYRWSEFPFQLCSIPIYMCLIAPWLKPGKVQRGMYSFMVLFNLLGGAISFAEPSGLLHNYWFLTVHALMWHMVLVFIGLFICFAGHGGNEKSDYIGGVFTFLALSAVAFGMNCFVQYGLGEHMNMFFVGPGNSPIAVFSLFSEWFGWYINTPIYLFALCLGAYMIFLLINFLQNRSKKKNKEEIAV